MTIKTERNESVQYEQVAIPTEVCLSKRSVVDTLKVYMSAVVVL
jgi:hypothetical protein